MAICKFFLENRCRFGENCRFEHPRNGAQRNLFGSGAVGGGDGSNQKVTFRDSFGTANNNQSGNSQFKWVANQNTAGTPVTQSTSAVDLVNALPKEMEMWEKTKMWPFSCLSVEKDAPSLPDFVDTSIEELRLEYYEVQKTGNIAAYTQKVQNLVMEFQNKRMQLKHMNMDMKQKLVSFIEQARKNKANQISSTSSSNVFGQSVTGSTNQTSGLFGKSPAGTTGQSSGLFGQSTAGSINQPSGLFGQSSGGSLFGNSNAFSNPTGTSQSQTSLFGKTQGSAGGLFTSNQSTDGQSSIFGGSKTSGGLFGGSSPSTNQNGSSGSIFGSPQSSSQQTSSVFGTSGNSSQSQTGGLFGKSVPGGSGSIFGNAGVSSSSGAGPGLFGNNQGSTPTPGLFGAPANASQPQSGLFGNAPGGGLLATPATPLNPGLFGKNTAPAPGSGLLATPSTGLFGQGSSPGLNPCGAGLFGKGPSTGTGLFGNTPSVNASSTGPGLFGKGPSVVDNSMGGGLFGKGPTPNASDPAIDKSLYSQMEELTAQDIEAFKASSFTLGKIPIKPPPKELIMVS